MPLRLRPIALLLALTLLSGPSLFAQGAARQDGGSARELPTFTAGALVDGLPRSVDLRPWLPPIGNQTMNDCVAWAFGYAGMSYLQAVDQGWKPDRPERQFSPTFIYNQINHGEDKGSQLPDALELLRLTGAATLATAPYLPKDYLSQPNEAAKEEAQNFRILDYDLVEDVDSIKQALASGNIVLVCARVNPEFMYGNFPLYTREIHERGSITRRPDQPHGFHAMAIVGYNDDRQALLFMNSWGTDWGNDGFMWVAYDLLDEFNYGEDKENLLEFAVVMVDRREPVLRMNGKYQVVSAEDLTPRLRGGFADVDEQGRQRWRFHLDLIGPPEVMAEIESVLWEIPGEAGRRQVKTSPETSFALTGTTTNPRVEVLGAATLRGGKQLPLSASLDLPTGLAVRQLSLKRETAYFDRTADKTPIFRCSYLPKMSDADWRALTTIRYRLDGVAEDQQPPLYHHAGGLPPVWSVEEPAYLNLQLQAPAPGTAELSFSDGSNYLLDLPMEAFPEKVGHWPLASADWRLEGVDGDRRWFYYQIRLDYPEAWAPLIAGAMCADPQGNPVVMRPVGGPGPKHFVYSGFSDAPFLSGATLSFREPHPQYGRTYPAPVAAEVAIDRDASWVKLNGDAAGIFPPNEPGYTQVGFFLRCEDIFLGETADGPRYRYTLRLDGTANLWAFSEVTWLLPDGEYRLNRDEGADPGSGYAISFEGGPGPIPIQARTIDGAGQERTLTKAITAHTPRNDALYLDLEQGDAAALLAQSEGRHLSRLRLLGRGRARPDWRRVEAIVPRAWGGIRRNVLLDLEPGQDMPEELGKLETLDGKPVTFLLHDADGWVHLRQATPHIPGVGAVAPRLQLEVQDRYDGLHDGEPTWEVTVELHGYTPDLQGTPHWQIADLAGRPMKLSAETPLRLHGFLNQQGVVHMTLPRGEGEEPFRLEAPLLLASEPAGATPQLRWQAVYAPEDPYAAELMYADDSPIDYEVTLVIDPAQLREYESIQWSVRDLLEESFAEDTAPSPQLSVEALEPAAGHLPSRRVSCFADWPKKVSATLTAADGHTLEVPEVEVGGEDLSAEIPPLATILSEVRPWGVVDGRRMSLALLTVRQPSWTEQLIEGEFRLDPPLQVAGGGPFVSLDRPVMQREFLFTEAFDWKGVDILSLEEGTFRLRSKEHDLPHTRLASKSGVAKPRVFRLACPWPRTTVLEFQADEGQLAEADAVDYLVTGADGKVVRYHVSERIGSFSDRFELRLVGDKPRSIRAELRRGEEVLVRTDTMTP